MINPQIKNIIISSLESYHPEMIGLFGSFMRDGSHKNSDLDILVRFKEALSFLQLIKLENELSEKIGIKVDLVTEGAVKNQRIKKSIDKDLQIIFQA